MGRPVRLYVFRVYIALNMLLASLIPGGLPRETISGRVGRCWPNSWGCRLIDRMHPWEPGHCVLTARQERNLRTAMCYATVTDNKRPTNA